MKLSLTMYNKTVSIEKKQSELWMEECTAGDIIWELRGLLIAQDFAESTVDDAFADIGEQIINQ